MPPQKGSVNYFLWFFLGRPQDVVCPQKVTTNPQVLHKFFTEGCGKQRPVFSLQSSVFSSEGKLREIRHQIGMGEYRDLKVWKKSMGLALDIYRATQSLPLTERFGLRVQLRRAAVSIPSNVAEGAGRGSDAELRRFVSYAYGSLVELETQLLLVKELGFLDPESCGSLLDTASEVGKMLNGLRTYLRAVTED